MDEFDAVLPEPVEGSLEEAWQIYQAGLADEKVVDASVGQAADQIAVVFNTLTQAGPDSPLARLAEYLAYRSMVRLAHGAVHEQLVEGAPAMDQVVAWIMTPTALAWSPTERIKKGLARMRDEGDKRFDQICERYCRLRSKIEKASAGGTILLSVDAVGALLLAWGADFLYVGGIPITAFLTYLVYTGALDDLCKCKEREEERKKEKGS